MSEKSKNPLYLEKWKIVQLLGVSRETVRKMLNVYYFDDLKKAGYRKTTKILYQHQLDIVFPLGLDFEMNKKT